jgi:hypothetical protein
MSFSQKPAFGFSTTVAAQGTAVSLTTQPPENAHTLIVYNSHATNDLFLAWQTTNAQITAVNGITVPAKTALTLSIGVRSQRPSGQTGGAAETIWLDASGATTVAYVTYVNGTIG